MKVNFLIDFEISDDEWRRSAGLRFRPESEPIFDAFNGNVRIQKNAEDLFPQANFNMSIADLAVGLCEILDEGFPNTDSPTTKTFRQSDDALEVYFAYDGENVQLSCNLRDSNILKVTRAEFVNGVSEFLEKFIREATEHIPLVLDWKDLNRLVYRPRRSMR